MTRHLVWAAGGLVMVPLDALHVTSGTIPSRAAGLEAAVPMFLCAGIVVGLLHRHVVTRIAALFAPRGTSVISGGRALVVGLAFVAAYTASSLVLEHTIAAALSFAALFATIAVTTPRDRRPALFVMAVGAGVVGPAFEGSLSASGAFAYAHADVFHVPAWLPALYLLTGAAVSTVDGWLESRPRRS